MWFSIVLFLVYLFIVHAVYPWKLNYDDDMYMCSARAQIFLMFV